MAFLKKKVYKSNNAHHRLHFKHKKRKYHNNKVKSEYHATVAIFQAARDDLLPWNDKKKIFKAIDKKHLNNRPKKSNKAYKDDFDRDKNGRIKGSYTVDGFFEPD